jgi:hypothetical protein
LIKNIVIDCSHSPKPFVLTAKPKAKEIEEANKYVSDDFIFVNTNQCWYKQKYWQDIEKKFCSCSAFLDRAICRHYISICKLKNLWLNDDEKEFYIVEARGRPKKSNNGALKKI